jgi:hypothetical protein
MLLTITNATRSENSWHTRALLGVVMALGGALPSASGQYQAPPPPLTTAPCVPTKKAPCTQPVAPPATTPSTAERFPFPGETTSDIPPEVDVRRQPVTDAPQPAVPGAPTPPEPDGSSSSSSSSSSAGGLDPAAEPPPPALADRGSSGSTRASRRHLAKVEDLDEREARDLEVSHYYVTTGNFLAAYMRAKDALATIPDDPQAHFAVAETAQRMQKKDEAIAEYTIYLKLEPDGNRSKAAQRALETLKP